MDKFSTVLSQQFDVSLAENFHKQALYYGPMDFLEYVSEDTTTVADRIDGFLTVLLSADDQKLVGFRLKGFKWAFNTHIQPNYKLQDEDFDPIKFALQRFFTDVGNTITADNGPSNPERDAAYKEAMQLAKRDQVSLPEEFAAAI